jgi:hypothetical protein
MHAAALFWKLTLPAAQRYGREHAGLDDNGPGLVSEREEDMEQ